MTHREDNTCQHGLETEARAFPCTRLSIQSEYRRFSQQRTPSNCTQSSGQRQTQNALRNFCIRHNLMLDSVMMQSAFPDCDRAILLRMAPQQLHPLVGVILTQRVDSLEFSDVLVLDLADDGQEGRSDAVWNRQLCRDWKPGSPRVEPRKLKQAHE